MAGKRVAVQLPPRRPQLLCELQPLQALVVLLLRGREAGLKGGQSAVQLRLEALVQTQFCERVAEFEPEVVGLLHLQVEADSTANELLLAGACVHPCAPLTLVRGGAGGGGGGGGGEGTRKDTESWRGKNFKGGMSQNAHGLRVQI